MKNIEAEHLEGEQPLWQLARAATEEQLGRNYRDPYEDPHFGALVCQKYVEFQQSSLNDPPARTI